MGCDQTVKGLECHYSTGRGALKVLEARVTHPVHAEELIGSSRGGLRKVGSRDDFR